MRRQWVVRLKLADGRVLTESRFRSRRQAKALANWHAQTAVGGHRWQTSIPDGSAPMWSVEVYKESR